MLAEVGAKINVVSHETPVHRGDIGPKAAAYLSHIDRREETLREYLRQPRTMREIIDRRIVYGDGRPGPWFDYGEWALMSKHLEGMLAKWSRREPVRDYPLRIVFSSLQTFLGPVPVPGSVDHRFRSFERHCRHSAPKP